MSRVNFLSVVIVTYNSKNQIQTCLATLFCELKKTKKEKIVKNYEVIVIDNNSTDKTKQILKNTKNIKTIFNKQNLGFAKAINQGIKYTKRGEIFLILNPDTKIKNSSINFLIKCLANNNAHIVGGKTIRTDGIIHGSCVTSPDWKILLFDYSNLRKLLPGDFVHKKHYYFSLVSDCLKPRKVDVVSGAYMLITKEVFQKIGYFDENFFMYLEDVDFCTRAKKKGLKTLFCPKSKIIHIGGASSKNKDKINHKAWLNSRKYYAKKHFSKILNFFLFQPIFTLDELLIKTLKTLK